MRKTEQGFATVYILIAVGVLSLLLVLAGKWIIALKQDIAVQEVEKQALADSVNAAAIVADTMIAANVVLNEQLVVNTREKLEIRAKYNRTTRGVENLERTNNDVKSWIDRCNPVPDPLYLCLRAGNCGEGIGSPNP